jgi:hypothetical protein
MIVLALVSLAPCELSRPPADITDDSKLKITDVEWPVL